MSLSDIIHPPQSWPQFVAQTYYDEEYFRKSAGGVTYARGGHYGYDNQDPDGDRELLAVGFGSIQHVDFGPYLGTRQFVLRFSDGTGYFYAHTFSRLSDGDKVVPGQHVGRMGNSSTAGIAVHLHHEYLKTWNNWYSPANAGPRLREMKAMAGVLSGDDKDFLRNAIELRLARLCERQNENLLKQMGDASDPVVNAILKQLADAYKLTGAEFRQEAGE